ncbi:hypothetical protein SeMB42_g07575 [Synchytrium endobioticum]|uniref:Uncharacterized protein n=1 Tax=Synchytrium endobioticum TaxID=286115 RepID=A0A507C478_9FUNG|nr:hypothetical protein SeMB42_g07575 [Synchytrium endobioticum]TPX36766.1 hypothetical protein SeLEV6574_g08015 [Synchytrium endobioticum]
MGIKYYKTLHREESWARDDSSWKGTWEVIGIVGSGIGDAAAPSLLNRRDNWYTGRGQWFNAPTIVHKHDKYRVQIPAEVLLKVVKADSLVFDSLEDVFNVSRDNSILMALYLQHIHRELSFLASRGRRFGALLLPPVVIQTLDTSIKVIDPLFQRALSRAVRSSDRYHFNRGIALPIIVDEIFSGLYRLGVRSGWEMIYMKPDILCLGSILGFLGAVLASREVFKAFTGTEVALYVVQAGAGNPVSCQMALDNLSGLMKSPMWDGRTERLKRYWDPEDIAKISKLGVVEGVVGIGTILAVTLNAVEDQNALSTIVTAKLKEQRIIADVAPFGVSLIVNPMSGKNVAKNLITGLYKALESVVLSIHDIRTRDGMPPLQSYSSSLSTKKFISSASLASVHSKAFIGGSRGSLGSLANLSSRYANSQEEGRAVAAKLEGAKSKDLLFTGAAASKEPTCTGVLRSYLTIKQPSEIFVTCFSPDDKYLIVGLGNSAIQVYSTQTNALERTMMPPNADSRICCTAISFRPDRPNSKTRNVLAATYADGRLIHWHYTSGQLLSSVTEPGNETLLAVTYKSDGSQYATAGSDAVVRIHDATTQKVTTRLELGTPNVSTGHINRVFSVKFHPTDVNMALSGGWDNTVQIWDLRTSVSVKSIFGVHLSGDGLDVTDDGQSIVTGSHRRADALQLWSWKDGAPRETIPWTLIDDAPCTKLYTAQFSHCRSSTPARGYADTNRFILAAGGGNVCEMRMFNALSKRCVGMAQNFGRSVYSCAVSHDERLVALGGADCALFVYEVDVMTPIDFAY